MNQAVQDLRYSWRMLTRRPGFALTAILTLAAGIGLNVAIFSVVNSIILRPLPYREPDRLVQIWESRPSEAGDHNVVSPTNFVDWRRLARSFESMSLYEGWLPAFNESEQTTQLVGAEVSSDFFDVLGVAPQLGRTFRPEDEQAGRDPVVIVSYGFWQRRLGGASDVIGKSLTLSEKSYSIIGVLRPDYRHPRLVFDQQSEIWRPLGVSAHARPDRRGSHYLNALGRLKPGVRLEEARAEMKAVARQLELAYPETNQDRGVTLLPLHEEVTGKFSLLLLILQGAVGLVLLIACVNVANLLLVRVAVREREVAIRLALGAGRWQIARLLMTESVLLVVMGGGLGSLLAWWAVD
ncbi:MAG TPA: ABC transporter permease, partial [Blastocatellia bacterium]|nr:ABC transporter permease [Blastocatellia bacterium]